MYIHIFLCFASACLLFHFNRRFRILVRCAYLFALWLVCQMMAPFIQVLSPPPPRDIFFDENVPFEGFDDDSDTTESDDELVAQLAQHARNSHLRRRSPQPSSSSDPNASSSSSSKFDNKQSMSSGSSSTAPSPEKSVSVDIM